jgi:hypothetical protein
VSKRALWDFGHLAALSSIALAQPLFDLLGKNPEFFAARGAPGFDIVSFALILVLVPPLVLSAVEALVGLVSEPARRALHLVLVTLLLALIFIQTLKKSVHATDVVLIVLALAIGALATLAYARAAPVRSFMNVLTPVPLVFLFLFLVVSPVSKVAFASDATARNVGGVSRANLVVVLFDEFPVSSLMDRTGHVDAKRYPNFAELERTSTWFRNAYTIYDSTERAQPAIFDGDYPAKDKLPTSADHPNSIFTLLAKTHRLNVSEEATSVCPRDLCKDERTDDSYLNRMGSMADDLSTVWLHIVAPPDAEDELPSVAENWGNFGGGDTDHTPTAGPGDSPNVGANLNANRNKRFDDWVGDIKNTSRPALNFKHTLLPHVPWQYLPDGKQYRRTARDPIPGLSQESYKDPYQVDSLHQRHLLQAGFADYELGKLFRHLKRLGLFDKSLIAVAADHGVAFDVGKRDRRTLTRANAEEIGPIPFFLKAPAQKKARIDPTYAESVDILPTIFDVLNVNPKVHMDGHSAFSRVDRDRSRIRIFQRNTFKPIRFALGEWEARKRAVLARKLATFGQGSDGPLRLFRIGPDQDLLFKPVSDLTVTGAATGTDLDFPKANELRHVDLRTPTIPVHVTGYLDGVPTGRELAIVVNGRVAAVTRSYHLAINNKPIFAAMVPESFIRQGANRVDVYEVEGGKTLRKVGGV